MARFTFPDGFHWGVATSSHQIEGAWRADGKGESIWDRFSHTAGRTVGGANADVACDHYDRMQEDVDLMREIGLTSYRFSIAWPRIQPEGRGPVNGKGMDFYQRLVDTLLEAGIRPLPTLYHWDLPQALQDAGGWPERDLAGYFAEYAERCAAVLGDRVERIAIFNEPWIFTLLGHLLGTHAPGIRSFEAFARASHTVCMAQGDAFRAIKSVRPDLQIGTAFSMSACEPARDEQEDLEAAERYHRFANVFFLEPALLGRYPDAFVGGLPEEAMGIRPDDMERCRAPLDWIGINLYSRTRVEHRDDTPIGAMPGGEAIGPLTDMGWEVWPDALHDMVMRIHRDYDGPSIEVTENGCAYDDAPDANGRVQDGRRVEYLEGYIAALARAVEEGAQVEGYHAWSLLDNFEWAEGYEKRFGLIYVDFVTQTRTLKDSARWYARVIREHGLEI
ncbi:MAG: beta-glucosidase [Deltaproteobacteria bacterium]|nr:beta-glucosidase [Deltaproteobacteria bacterium]MBW2382399.1 beta-glucosidase [Deltaproteobacteria bacterium]MBW2697428.1 beta-glucosidase [Deltaproteobacteria bacterium]